MYDYYLTKTENNEYKNRQFVDIPAHTQKSFYGKAKFITYTNGFIGCLSYNTIVCVYNPNTGEFYKTWDDWSTTTSKHINSFMYYFGMRGFCKKDWLNLEYSFFNWIYNF